MTGIRNLFHRQKPANWTVWLLLSVFCFTASGCDLKLPPMPWDPPPKKEAEEGKDDHGEAGGEEVEPLDLNKLLPEAMRTLPYEEVEIPMKDQMMIYGRLYDPSLKPEGEEAEDPPTDEEGNYIGPKYPLVILLHGLNRDYKTWSDLPASLVKAGYAVLAMDLRGHGKSTLTRRKNRVSWRLFKKEHWLLLSKDVDEVIRYFQNSEDYPQVDGKTVALIGEKLGSNVAVYAARDMHDYVKAMILISPGLDYKGIIPSQAIVDYTNPALLITSQDDLYSYQSTERLYNWLLGPKALQVYKKIGDGSDMLSHRTTLGSQMTDWLVKSMPPSVTTRYSDAKQDEHSAAKTAEPAAEETPATPEAGHKLQEATHH
jgi:pimeloyl-ACP methyl ester carboxylesterase